MANCTDRAEYQVPAVHIWCNGDHREVKGADCPMCQRFHKAYPMDGFASDIEMAAKYFPNAIPRI